MTPASLDLSITTGITFRPFTANAQDTNGDPVDLTGYVPFAEVRKKPGSPVILDLLPSITNAATGEITFPGFTDEETFTMHPGQYRWDLILQLPNGERSGPYITGDFPIVANITKPAE